MAVVAIRVPSVEALFDAWSPEPLERRPLNDEARQRIVDGWIEATKRKRRPDGLALILPASEGVSCSLYPPDEQKEQPDVESAILTAIRHDMAEMRVDAKHHWIRRAIAPRESRIGFLVFICALLVAGLIDFGADEGSFSTMLSQTFVVLAWVALWGPAFRLMTAASFRLGRRSFGELAEAEIEIRWG